MTGGWPRKRSPPPALAAGSRPPRSSSSRRPPTQASNRWTDSRSLSADNTTTRSLCSYASTKLLSGVGRLLLCPLPLRERAQSQRPRACGLIAARDRLLLPRAARLDGRGPFLELTAHQPPEILGRAAFRRRHVEAEALEPFAHRRDVEDVARRLREPAHDWIGRVLGAEERIQAVHVEVLHALFVRGRKLGHHRAPGRRQRLPCLPGL